MHVVEEERPTPAAEEAPDEAPHALDDAIGQLREIAGELKALIDLRVERARVGAREAGFQLALAGLVFVAGAALIVFAAFFLARGVTGAIAEATGLGWAGDLTGGAAILLVLAALILVTRGWLRARGARRLARKPGGVDEGA